MSTGHPVASRDVAAAVVGAGIGAAVLWLASMMAANRFLVATALVTGGLTLWSAVDWRQSVTALGSAGPTPIRREATTGLTDGRRPGPGPVTPRESRHLRAPAPTIEIPVVGARSGGISSVSPTGGRASDARRARPSPREAPLLDRQHEPIHPTPSEQSPVPLQDLLNDQPVRELQCSSCASFDVVTIGSATGSALGCRSCGAATELDPAGRPHAVRVRSNPGRAAERCDGTATTVPRQINNTQTKEQR